MNEKYYTQMSQNITEKIDFIVKELSNSNYKKVVDIGCADGKTIQELSKLFNKLQFIGIDINSRLVENNNNSNAYQNITYITPSENSYKNLFDKNTLVIMSSVLHEIYSFTDKNSIKQLLSDISKSGGVAIRDMYFTPNSLQVENNLQYIKSKRIITKSNELLKVRNTKMSNEFITEMLLKSLYPDNWENEKNEKYFSTNWVEIANIFSENNLEKVYYNTYMNNYLLEKLPMLKDLTNTTHCKVIYKRLHM